MEIFPLLETLVPLPFVVALLALCEATVHVPVSTEVSMGAICWLHLVFHQRWHCFHEPASRHQMKPHRSNHVYEDCLLEGLEGLHQSSPTLQPSRRSCEHQMMAKTERWPSCRIEPWKAVVEKHNWDQVHAKHQDVTTASIVTTNEV